MNSLNNPIIIDKIREQLVTEMTAHPELYDECDLERIKTKDITIKRFLSHWKAEEKAFIKLRDAMKWRKSSGINTWTDLDFPLEFYKIGAVLLYSEDKEGTPVLYLRIKLNKYFPNISVFINSFIAHKINKVFTQSEEKGLVVVYDMTDAGPSNWDLKMLQAIFETLGEYFSDIVKYYFLYSVPWIMNPFVNIGLRIVTKEDRDRTKNLSKNEILEFIDKENLPDYMGGTCDRNYREAPEGAISLRDMAIKKGFPPQEVEKFLKYHDKNLK